MAYVFDVQQQGAVTFSSWKYLKFLVFCCKLYHELVFNANNTVWHQPIYEPTITATVVSFNQRCVWLCHNDLLSIKQLSMWNALFSNALNPRTVILQMLLINQRIFQYVLTNGAELSLPTLLALFRWFFLTCVFHAGWWYQICINSLSKTFFVTRKKSLELQWFRVRIKSYRYSGNVCIPFFETSIWKERSESAAGSYPGLLQLPRLVLLSHPCVSNSYYFQIVVWSVLQIFDFPVNGLSKTNSFFSID